MTKRDLAGGRGRAGGHGRRKTEEGWKRDRAGGTDRMSAGRGRQRRERERTEKNRRRTEEGERVMVRPRAEGDEGMTEKDIEKNRGGEGQVRNEKGGRPYACRPSVADRRAIRRGRDRSRRDRPARACPTGGPGRAAARGVGAGPEAHRRHAWRASPQPSFP